MDNNELDSNLVEMKNLKLTLISLIFIFFCLFLLEFFGRCYFYRKHGFGYKESFLYESDDTLGYKISSKYKGRHGTYYRGIRRDYFNIDKGNKIRIVCLGGSTTFGQGQFDNSRVWPQILERLLGMQKPDTYEVLNAGVCGYGSSNLLARLQKEILGLKPDIIIIFAGWNLVGCLKSKYSWVPENVVLKEHPLIIKINNFLINNSILYLKIKNAINNIFRIRQRTSGVDIFDKAYKGLLLILADDLKEMISICKQNNIIPLVIKYPSKDYNSRIYIDTISIIESICRENDVYLIDCSTYFESLNKESRAEYFTDIAHLTDKGNEKIAQIIYSALIDNGFVR